MPISIEFAKLEVIKAEVSEDEEVLNIELKNEGDRKVAKATVQLLNEFDKNTTQTIVNLEPNATLSVPFSSKGMIFDKNSSVEVLVTIANEKEILKNPSGTKIAPAYAWHSEGVKIDLKRMAWYLYALMALGALLLFWSVWYYKRYKLKTLEKP